MEETKAGDRDLDLSSEQFSCHEAKGWRVFDS
jgi:hypothetical protein